MTAQTLAFLRQMLCNQSVPVADPNFLALAQTAARALAEIDDAMAHAAERAQADGPDT